MRNAAQHNPRLRRQLQPPSNWIQLLVKCLSTCCYLYRVCRSATPPSRPAHDLTLTATTLNANLPVLLSNDFWTQPWKADKKKIRIRSRIYTASSVFSWLLPAYFFFLQRRQHIIVQEGRGEGVLLTPFCLAIFGVKFHLRLILIVKGFGQIAVCNGAAKNQRDFTIPNASSHMAIYVCVCVCVWLLWPECCLCCVVGCAACGSYWAPSHNGPQNFYNSWVPSTLYPLLLPSPPPFLAMRLNNSLTAVLPAFCYSLRLSLLHSAFAHRCAESFCRPRRFMEIVQYFSMRWGGGFLSFFLLFSTFCFFFVCCFSNFSLAWL